VRLIKYTRPIGENVIRRIRNFAYIRGMAFAYIIQVSYIDYRVDLNSLSGTNLAYKVLGCTDGKSKVDFINVRGRVVYTFKTVLRKREDKSRVKAYSARRGRNKYN